ncbi:MAG TPA: glycine betaine ABC transporter substrate-binding protein [Pelomicrobium sp.]|nr:glycine betaine ABC transporter substrate-binding protein [Pelomicrobium sp.]
MLIQPAAGRAGEPELRVGSKRFTESYVLGEVLRQQVEGTAGIGAVHKAGLGNTAIVFEALRSNAIDVYVDYTGTLAREILGLEDTPPIAHLNTGLAGWGLGAGVPLGFENTYALAMADEKAAALDVTRISDLARHPSLRFGLSQEFLGRRDGWPGVRRAYGLENATVRGVDHGLSYQAVAAGQIDVTDVYTTDAKIARYGLRVLVDDRHFFPSYDAVLVYRRDLPERLPQAWKALAQLEGTMDAATMRRLNARVEEDGLSFAQAAAEHLARRSVNASEDAPPRERSLLAAIFAPDLLRLTVEHAALVFGALALSTTIGVPLGVVCHRRRTWAAPILGLAGIIQTVPSLAMLALLIAAMDRIGAVPAVAALFLYGLLPIVRNTYVGLEEVPGTQRQAALALGLRQGQVLRLIEVPLALATLLAGVRTSAVINVGTATIAAFVGAGGLGDRIVAGLALNDHTLLLAGALPAAFFALAVEGGLAAIQRRADWRVRAEI